MPLRVRRSPAAEVAGPGPPLRQARPGVGGSSGLRHGRRSQEELEVSLLPGRAGSGVGVDAPQGAAFPASRLVGSFRDVGEVEDLSWQAGLVPVAEDAGGFV